MPVDLFALAPAITAGVAVAVALLLAAERRGDAAPGARAAAKGVASTLFVVLALALGASATAYGQVVLVALALSWLGDVLLIPRGRGAAFTAGLVAFLLGHVAYGVAFLVRGVSTVALVEGLVVMAATVFAAARWLGPHLTGRLRVPVAVYLVVVALMAALAVGATGRGATPLIAVGGLAFAVSDIAVARERFVTRDFRNKAWGLPLYYAAQVMLAWSIVQ